VREAFFAALAAWNGSADAGPEAHLDGVAFLDLYAGSGAVGLEAASRGAAPVWLVDNDARAAQAMRANVAATGLRAQVQQRGVQAVVGVEAGQVFDVVWLDPPYPVPTATVNDVVRMLFEQGWVADDGVVVAERSTRGEPVTMPGHEQWSKKYGETTLYWISARRSEPEQREPSADESGST